VGRCIDVRPGDGYGIGPYVIDSALRRVALGVQGKMKVLERQELKTNAIRAAFRKAGWLRAASRTPSTMTLQSCLGEGGLYFNRVTPRHNASGGWPSPYLKTVIFSVRRPASSVQVLHQLLSDQTLI